MELPRVQPIFEKYRDQGLQVLAVEINNDRAGADKFIAEHGLTFIFAAADRAFVKQYFNTATYPNAFIIDREGRIREHKIGFKAGDEVELEAKLKEILAEK